MTREKFFKELVAKLKRIPDEERDNALIYYHEYFDEAGPENEAKVIAELGDPNQIAEQILADYDIKKSEDVQPQSKKLPGYVIALLAIFAIPIGIPLLLAGVMVVVSLLFALFMVYFSFILVAFCLILVGVMFIIVSFVVFPAHFPTGIFLFGSSLLLVGIGLLLLLVMILLVKVTSRGLGYLYRKLRKGAKK